MKKQILTLVMLLAVVGFGYAQDSGSQSSGGDFAPSAGDISASFLFGRGQYLSALYGSGVFVPPSASLDGDGNVVWNVPGSAPILSTYDANSNDVTNMVGAEVRYFVTNRIAAKLSGGAIIRNTPAVDNIPNILANDPNGNNAAWIPAYQAVVADNRFEANINLGGEYHFTTKYSRLFPWAGLNIPFSYARRSLLDPTIGDDPTSPTYITDIGVRHSHVWGLGLQATAGFDYYIAEGLYFGFEIKPISYIYTGAGHYPAPGLEALKAETFNWAFFAQPVAKIGIRF